jgi:hypothetical protein
LIKLVPIYIAIVALVFVRKDWPSKLLSIKYGTSSLYAKGQIAYIGLVKEHKHMTGWPLDSMVGPSIHP